MAFELLDGEGNLGDARQRPFGERKRSRVGNFRLRFGPADDYLFRPVERGGFRSELPTTISMPLLLKHSAVPSEAFYRYVFDQYFFLGAFLRSVGLSIRTLSGQRPLLRSSLSSPSFPLQDQRFPLFA
jgi:hypothetical protein